MEEISHEIHKPSITKMNLKITYTKFHSDISWANKLTHWSRVMPIIYIYSSKLTIIGSDNGLSPGQRQAIIWTNAGILLIQTLGAKVSEILSDIHTFPFEENAFENAVCKMVATLSQPQCINRVESVVMHSFSSVILLSWYITTALLCFVIQNQPKQSWGGDRFYGVTKGSFLRRYWRSESRTNGACVSHCPIRGPLYPWASYFLDRTSEKWYLEGCSHLHMNGWKPSSYISVIDFHIVVSLACISEKPLVM